MKRYSLIKCLYYNFVKAKNTKLMLMIKPGTNIFIDSKTMIPGNGRLFFNTNKSEKFKALCYFQMRRGGELKLENDNLFHYGSDVCIFEGGKLELNGCSLNGYSQIRCKNRIAIGKGTIISRNVQIWDADHHKLNNEADEREIIIGDHVWVGANATILKGVHIGDGAVVAAGSVVTRDVPAGSLVAGGAGKSDKRDCYMGVLRRDSKGERPEC